MMNKTTTTGLLRLQDMLEKVVVSAEEVQVSYEEAEQKIEDNARCNQTCRCCGNTSSRDGKLTGDEEAEIDQLQSQAQELDDVQDDLQKYIDAADLLLSRGWDSTLDFLTDQYPEVKI